MTVADRNTLYIAFPVTGGGASPPGKPEKGYGGGGGPGNDRARLMLLIYDNRGKRPVSLEYLRGWTGFCRERVWRGFEDLEDMGYVEVLEEDPRGRLSRWLDEKGAAADRLFAATFLTLTEAGRHGPELQASLAALEDARRDQRPSSGARVSIREGLSRLLRKHTSRR